MSTMEVVQGGIDAVKVGANSAFWQALASAKATADREHPTPLFSPVSLDELASEKIACATAVLAAVLNQPI